MHQEGRRLSLATLVLVFDSNNTELCVNILTCLTACGALSVFQSFSICLSTSTNVYFSLFHSLPSSSCQLVQPFFSWNIQNLNFQSIFEFFYRPLSVTPSSFSWQIRNKFNKVTKAKQWNLICVQTYIAYIWTVISVERAVTSKTWRPRFESSHRQNFIKHIFTASCLRDKN